MLKSFLSWKVWLNVLIAIGFFAVLVWATFRWLDHHTNYGKEVPVPNVVDMPVQQAVKTLEDMGLTIEVDSFKYDPKYRSFQVLQIYPSAGSRVKEGRTIILKVNPRTWAKVEVPDVLDKYKGLAYSRLELVGLKVGDTIYEANIQKDAVIRMEMDGRELKPGTLLPKFSMINLVIGTGPMRNISTPNLIGLTVREARQVIKTNHFEIGVVEHENNGDDENDIVYYQTPAMGDLRDQGMQIDLWASSKTPAQMHLKIKELDQIYRPHSLPEEQIDYVFDRNEPTTEPIQQEKPKTEKVQKKVEDKPVAPPKEKKKVEEKKQPATSEKPKNKQVIVE